MHCYRCNGLLVKDLYDDRCNAWRCVNCGGVMPCFYSDVGKRLWVEKTVEERRRRIVRTL